MKKFIYSLLFVCIVSTAGFATEQLTAVPIQYQGQYTITDQSSTKGETWRTCDSTQWAITIKSNEVFIGDRRLEIDRIVFTVVKNTCYILIHFPNGGSLVICQISEGNYLLQQFNKPNTDEAMRYIIQKI